MAAGELADVAFEADATLSVAEVNAAYAWAEWPEREAWRIEEASRHSRWFVARSPGGELVGVVRVLDDGGLYASVWDLLVRPDWRGTRVASRLMELALDTCRDRRLVALVATPAARGLYERLGFVTESHGHAAMYLRPQAEHIR
jgi:GNAT superfamily N-acetyltransferase